MLVLIALPVSAQDAIPSTAASPSPAAVAAVAANGAWPSGDDLRRDLQEIGFAFRVDRDSGDWLGWAPRASVVEAAAIRLGGSGNAAATARVRFDLLQTDLLGGDVEAALTALMEMASRLPLQPAGVERVRRFVVVDLLTEPPESLEPCYHEEGVGGAILVRVEAETGIATLDVAPNLGAIASSDELDVADCAFIRPSTAGPVPGEPSSERVTVNMTAGEPPTFEPAELTVEGELVTLILTFANESMSEQSLTFDAPLEASTGPVAPGDRKLIVIRQLESGSYRFSSDTDPSGLVGTINIVARDPT
jgi:hypothetical protein